MPPSVPRKRPGPASSPAPTKRRKGDVRGRPSVFKDIDTNAAKVATPEQTKQYLDSLGDSDSVSDDSDDDHDFEDVPGVTSAPDQASDADDHESMDWEDAGGSDSRHDTLEAVQDSEIADVTVTLNDDVKYATATDRAASTVKKGPSKRERQVRNGTHCLHVQSLMWHNAVRNAWLNDAELHQILLQGLPEGVRMEIDRWRANMGMPRLDVQAKDTARAAKLKRASAKNRKKRGGRDWDVIAERQEKGKINMSQGDPTLKLLKILTAYWRKRFNPSAPGIRKLGYMPLKRLTQEINAWKKDKTGQIHGERLDSVADLRRLAKSYEGSRDVGSQLFTALMRALGLEARMVANLQPAGIGWGKIEEARPAKERSLQAISNDSGSDDAPKRGKKPPKAKPITRPTKPAATAEAAKPARKSARTSSENVIVLDTDSDSPLSAAPSDIDDATSVIDVTEDYSIGRPGRKYDRDMHYPNYWTEVLSPVSNLYIPVDPMVLSTIATNGELLASFEPRGKRAEQAKQVICYTIGHSSDGTAKDVTVRYLRKHQLPGRTKGYRMPIEKIKVYDRKGKVKKYEDYDWFKTVMSVFDRPDYLRTAADDLEEATDLKPLEIEVAKPSIETESLQWYKQSADFVLERHLRREEAILPSSQPVKSFTSGKGDKEITEPVYRRKDVIECKTAESWHKQGREIKIGEQPMKLVPMRAVTTTRKREMEDIERETGEKAKQGLFARSQTDWIIPLPIGEDRVIPRNAFGNIDVYVPSMVPKGAVHLPYKGTARVCRDLNISHAEAVTGFEFGKRMAIPVITGVVIPEEHKKAVLDLWREREAIKKQKEDAKKSQACLALWRKLFTGLRIMERMKREYADTGNEEDLNPFVRKAKALKMETNGHTNNDAIMIEADGVEEGGFIRDDDDDDIEEPRSLMKLEPRAQDIDLDLGGGESGGFLPESDNEQDDSLATTPATQPQSLRASKTATNGTKHHDSEPVSDSATDSSLPASRATNGKKPAPKKSVARKSRSSVASNTPTRGHSAGKTTTPGSSLPSNARSKKQTAQRVSPTKSQYFAVESSSKPKRKSTAATRMTDSEQEESSLSSDEAARPDDDADDDSSDEEEVVAPRRTTARTRTRR